MCNETFTCFLQINLTIFNQIHKHIVLFDISVTCFSFFVSINLSVVKHLLKGVVNKSHFSHLMLNPLRCDVLKVEFTQYNRFLLFLLLSCVINNAQLTFIYSKSTVEPVCEGVEYVQS